MKTSTIRHPKFSHCLVVHSWQVKACDGDIIAANSLAYLEAKYNLLQELKEKNGGWMKLVKFQLKNGVYAPSFESLNRALDKLEELDFATVLNTEDEPSLAEGEVMIRFHAAKINKYLDDYTVAVHAVNPYPFLASLMINQSLADQLAVKETEEEKEEKNQKWRKGDDETFIENARQIFGYWKSKLNHPKSNMQLKCGKQIIDRLKDGYHPQEIAHAIIGLTFSEYHIANKYDHIQYVVREGKSVDRFRRIAEQNRIGFVEASMDYEKYKNGESVESDVKFINKSTGSELK